MLILHKLLEQFDPKIKNLAPRQLVDILFSLGFETDIIEREVPILDLEITPNRGDAMNHLGIARDIVAYLEKDSASNPKPLILEYKGGLDSLEEFKNLAFLVDDKLCSQYHGLIIEGVKIKDSPNWLKQELLNLDLRPINNVVDLTNYFMELYGQPLHAFDFNKIRGQKINVRESSNDESLITLDGLERTPPSGSVVIEDNEGLIDLAGIMGGKISEVDKNTTTILLQSALFNRDKIRTTGTALNHRTPAAIRYERGVDPLISLGVLEKFLELITKEEFGGFKAAYQFRPLSTTIPDKSIEYDYNRSNKLLGANISRHIHHKNLQSLGCDIVDKGKILGVSPPSWRYDLVFWQDLAEEVIRLEGVSDLSPETLVSEKIKSTVSEWENAESLKDILTCLGLNEVQTYSFLSKGDLDSFNLTSAGELANAQNPFLKFLRPSLVPGIARVIATNPAFDPINVFEIGHIFEQNSEKTALVIGLAGRYGKLNQWITRLEEALDLQPGLIEKSSHIISLNNEQKKAYKIRRDRVDIIEIDLEKLLTSKKLDGKFSLESKNVNYKPVSKFPPSSRDIALVINQSTDSRAVELEIKKINTLVENVLLFDEYISNKLGKNKKSLAFRVFFSNINKTLTQHEVDEAFVQITQEVSKKFDAKIR